MTKTTKATHTAFETELFAPVIKDAVGNYIAVLSDTSMDRDEERVGEQALNKIDLNGYTAGLLDHENKVLGQVCTWINKRVLQIDGHTALVAEPKFFESNPNAKIIKGMLDEGAELGISIGAIVNDYIDEKINGKTVRTFTELELLEASFVAVPSNRHGRIVAVAKSFNKKEKTKKMSEEKKFTQKEFDSAISDKNLDLNKKLESKDLEISNLSKKVDEKDEEIKESNKSFEKANKELVETKEELEKQKKSSLEKQRFADQGGNEGNKGELSEDDIEKAFKSGKIPVGNIR